MKRSDLSPFFKNRIWAVRVIGVGSVLFSPIIIPIWILYRNRKDFIECWKAICETFEPIND